LSQHQIIKETSDSLTQLLTAQFKDYGYKRVHIIVAAPKPDAIEGKLPAVCLYLYQVSVDVEGIDGHVHDEIVEVINPDGSTKEAIRRQPLWVRLDYLISTWAQNPEDEQLLLGLAIKACMENPSLVRSQLKGDSFEHDFELPLYLTSRLDEGTLARFWASLNQPVRPAFQVWSSVPIMSDKLKDFRRVEAPTVIRTTDLNSPGGKAEDFQALKAIEFPPNYKDPGKRPGHSGKKIDLRTKRNG
jgi:hypothetical protein